MLTLQNIFQTKRLFAAFAISAVLCLTACGGSGGSNSSNSSENGKLQNPYFYSIMPRSGQLSYMLGTIHIAVGIEELPSYVLSAYSEANYHLSEIIEVYQPLTPNLELMQSAHSRETFNSTYNRLKPKLKAKGPLLTKEQIRRAQSLGIPDYVAKVTGQKAACQTIDLIDYMFAKPLRMLDFEMGALSRTQKKQVAALENNAIRLQAAQHSASKGGKVEEQCEIADLISDDETTSLVKNFLKQRPYEKLVNQYRSGEPITDPEHALSIEFRNKKWIPVMKTYIAKGGAFFSFGALHLEGQNGIIKLLEREGYKVTRHNSATTIPLRHLSQN